MSIKIVGKAKLPETDSITVYGKPGKEEDVDVNIPSLGNRDTQASKVKSNLKDGNKFVWNWQLYQRIIVAEFSDGSRNLLDGDHRRHMYKLTFPEAITIPAYIIKVESEEEFHKLFFEINWEKRKNATKEEVFVHQVRAKIESAVALNLKLIACGVSVYGSSDSGGVVGFVNGPHVTVGAFKRALRHGTAETKKAINTIRMAWGTDPKLQGELMEAVALLYVLYPFLSDGSKIEADFEEWFRNHLSMYGQHTVAADYKSRGGRVHHKHAESIARGLISDFRRIQLLAGANAKYKQKKLSLKLINNLID